MIYKHFVAKLPRFRIQSLKDMSYIHIIIRDMHTQKNKCPYIIIVVKSFSKGLSNQKENDVIRPNRLITS